MPLLETKGAASAQGFGLTLGGAAPVYIEDVFSTWLYTGNGSTQTITNGIDLAGKGGLVWMKGRSGATDNALYDTTRGATKELVTNSFSAQTTQSTGLTAFNGTGFSLGALAKLNTNAATYASWTFREQSKFFDVITWTGDGSATRDIAHNLGSTPGMVIVRTYDTANFYWVVWHRSLGQYYYLKLDQTDEKAYNSGMFKNVDASKIQVGSDGNVNSNGKTYVAYLFAHDAGGFGLTGTDNVISCGSYTGNGSATGPVVSLGYEPQWLMIKNASGTGNWQIIDNMRGMPVGSADATLQANLTNAESSTDYVSPTSTGFQVVSTSTEVNTNASTYIYIAIRRGPMKTPTSGTSVFGLNARTGTSANATVTGGAGVTDLAIIKRRLNGTSNWVWTPRLTGTGYLSSNLTAAEIAAGTEILQANPWDVMDGVKVGTGGAGGLITNRTGESYINYLIDRAPGFFDVVCYTGNDVSRNLNHNLGTAPQLWIIKARSTSVDWSVGSSLFSSVTNDYLALNLTDAKSSLGNFWNTPTTTTFGFGSGLPSAANINAAGQTYVAYLFASCPGVSKVGSYTGNGTNQTINCGFTGGARFVLIKRTDSTGDWYVWDTARGIVAGNDPRLSLNSTAAEVTTDDSVDTDSTGFIVNQLATTNINVNAATYIYLAIA